MATMEDSKECSMEADASKKDASVFKQNFLQLHQYIRALCKKKDDNPDFVIRGRVFLLFILLFFGLLILIIAMATPDVIIVTQQQGRVHTRLGFFMQCTSNPNRPDILPRCEHQTLQELAGPVAMYFLSIFCSFAALFLGLKFVLWTPPGSLKTEKSRKSYDRIRYLCFLSGLGSVCGVISITYLYHEFIDPVLIGFILLWVVAAIHIAAALLGFCFRDTSSRNAVAPKQETEDVASSLGTSQAENDAVRQEV